MTSKPKEYKVVTADSKRDVVSRKSRRNATPQMITHLSEEAISHSTFEFKKLRQQFANMNR